MHIPEIVREKDLKGLNCLPVEKNQACQHSIIAKGQAQEAQSLAEKLMAVNSCWKRGD